MKLGPLIIEGYGYKRLQYWYNDQSVIEAIGQGAIRIYDRDKEIYNWMHDIPMVKEYFNKK